MDALRYAFRRGRTGGSSSPTGKQSLKGLAYAEIPRHPTDPLLALRGWSAPPRELGMTLVRRPVLLGLRDESAGEVGFQDIADHGGGLARARFAGLERGEGEDRR